MARLVEGVAWPCAPLNYAHLVAVAATPPQFIIQPDSNDPLSWGRRMAMRSAQL